MMVPCIEPHQLAQLIIDGNGRVRAVEYALHIRHCDVCADFSELMMAAYERHGDIGVDCLAAYAYRDRYEESEEQLQKELTADAGFARFDAHRQNCLRCSQRVEEKRGFSASLKVVLHKIRES